MQSRIARTSCAGDAIEQHITTAVCMNALHFVTLLS